MNPLTTSILSDVHPSGQDNDHSPRVSGYQTPSDTELDASREMWNLEAGDIRRYVESLTNFDPHAGIQPPPKLTSAGELELQRILSEPFHSNGSTPHVPTSLLNRNRHRRTLQEWCPRAQAQMVRRGDTTVVVWPECKSRTCSVCRPRIDDRDTNRVLHAFQGSKIWLSEIPIDDWGTTSKRLRRHGSTAVKMASKKNHDRIAVLSSEPITPDAIAVTDETVRDVVSTRPPGSPPQKGHLPRPRLSGIGLPTIREWEQNIASGQVDEAVDLDKTITPDALADAADGLGIDYTRRGRLIELHAEWDSPEMVTLRSWARDPLGGWKMWLRNQQGLTDEPPLELFEPPPEEYAA
jgi:hypothetical protein